MAPELLRSKVSSTSYGEQNFQHGNEESINNKILESSCRTHYMEEHDWNQGSVSLTSKGEEQKTYTYIVFKDLLKTHCAQEKNDGGEKLSLIGAAAYKRDRERFEDIRDIGERVSEDKVSVSMSSRGILQPTSLKQSNPSPSVNDVSLELTLA